MPNQRHSSFAHQYVKHFKVEHLEQQLQEMTRSLSEVQQRQKDVETERDEAVEKIKVLRDIIRDLEQQSESTAARLDGYESRVQELQRCLLECQEASGKAHDSTVEVAELYAHIEHLENEVQRLRTYSELVGSKGALTELKRQVGAGFVLFTLVKILILWIFCKRQLKVESIYLYALSIYEKRVIVFQDLRWGSVLAEYGINGTLWKSYQILKSIPSCC